MPAEITDTGLVAQTALEIFEEIGVSFQDSGYPDADVTTDSPFGKWNWPAAMREAAVQAALSSLLWMFDPETAQGAALLAVASLRGTQPLPATNSTVSLRLSGTASTDLSGRRVRYVDSGHPSDGTLWILPDATVISGAGFVDASATAVDTGPLETDAGGSFEIVDAVGGWTGATALAVASPGTDAETYPELRARLRANLSSVVGTEPGGFRAVSEVPGVDLNTLFPHLNRTNGVDPYTGNGPHSLEVVVSGGNPQAIGEAILRGYSSCADYVGTVEVNITLPEDSRVRIVRFTPPTAARLYAQIVVKTTGAKVALPTNAEATLRAGLVEWAEALVTSENASAGPAESYLLALLPEGSVTDIDVVFSSDAAVYSVSEDPGPRAYWRLSNDPSSAQIVGDAEPFTISAGWQLDLRINGGPTQSTVFPLLTGATAATVAAAISLSGATASANSAGQIVFTTITTGSSASIEVEASSTAALLTELGLTTGTVTGLNSDITSFVIV